MGLAQSRYFGTSSAVVCQSDAWRLPGKALSWASDLTRAQRSARPASALSQQIRNPTSGMFKSARWQQLPQSRVLYEQTVPAAASATGNGSPGPRLYYDRGHYAGNVLDYDNYSHEFDFKCWQQDRVCMYRNLTRGFWQLELRFWSTTGYL